MRSETSKRILSETSDLIKQNVREKANEMVMKQQDKKNIELAAEKYARQDDHLGLSGRILSPSCFINGANYQKQVYENLAIDFAEWMHSDTTYIGNGLYRVINDENHYKLPKIFEIFKKERGIT